MHDTGLAILPSLMTAAEADIHADIAGPVVVVTPQNPFRATVSQDSSAAYPGDAFWRRGSEGDPAVGVSTKQTPSATWSRSRNIEVDWRPRLSFRLFDSCPSQLRIRLRRAGAGKAVPQAQEPNRQIG